MAWISIVYLLGLFYLAIHMDRVVDRGAFRSAWICYALIPLSNFVMGLFRAGQSRDPRAMITVEIWAEALPALFLGISLLFLLKSLVRQDDEARD
jgi:O-antigen/teichoic acid export membrane protein